MIRSYFGIENNPFSMEDIELLPHQQEVYDILQVHSQQGGLCLVMGEPGTGKTVIKDAIKHGASKRMAVVTVARTLHTYNNTLKILCQAFNIEFESVSFKCEKNLIEEAFSLNRQGKMLVTIIDDAHLMEMQTLRKLRLLLLKLAVLPVGEPAAAAAEGEPLAAAHREVRLALAEDRLHRRRQFEGQGDAHQARAPAFDVGGLHRLLDLVGPDAAGLEPEEMEHVGAIGLGGGPEERLPVAQQLAGDPPPLQVHRVVPRGGALALELAERGVVEAHPPVIGRTVEEPAGDGLG